MSGDASRDDVPWPSYALPRGTSVNGYRIERVLGSGGFGVTYLAHDLLRQRFAIKEYFPRQFAVRQDLSVLAASAEDTPLFDECRDRFLREAQALVLLGRVAGVNDGIVRVQTYFEAHGTCFLVMDYVEGTSLASLLRQEPGGLPAPRVGTLLSQLLSSLGVVHRAGLVHRDIKPANIMLRDDDRAVLIDFGSSREVSSGQTTAYTQIYSGGYAPPEQMLGLHQGEFSDIYAIGAVCYRAIGGTLLDALARQNALAGGRPDPQSSAEQIGAGRYPRSLLAMIDAALKIDPAQRPQNVNAMLGTLGLGTLGHDDPTVVVTRAAPVAPASPPRRDTRGMKWGVLAGIGALAVVAAAYVVVHFAQWSPDTPPPASSQQVAASTPAPAVPPQAAPAIAAPDAAPAVTAQPVTAPEPSPPAELPPPAEPLQREAVVVPPVQVPEPAPTLSPQPVPSPQPSPSPVELARAAAMSLPCSVLNVVRAQDGMRVSGIAAAGQELDRLLGDLRASGRIADDVTRVDRFACPPIATLAALARQTWDSTPPAFALRLDQRYVASGARLAIKITTSLPVLYVDLYQGDGSVRHLLRPGPSGLSGRPLVDWVATPPAGPRMVVAIGAATALDIGSRPETERTADYLAALQPALERAAVPPVVDLAMVTVRAAEPAVAKVPQPRPTSLRSDRCANIVSRAQLGETLSDAELAALRAECRS